MEEIIKVRFKNGSKIFTYSSGGRQFSIGDYVICRAPSGVECGRVVGANRPAGDNLDKASLKPVLRPASEEDMKAYEKNCRLEKEAAPVCEKYIQKHKLDMKLVRVSYNLDRSKMLFYFTSDNRVDFRALVKDLAAVFHTRIELRQIGVRDEAQMLGGLGVCGRPYCCSSYLQGFHPVSIKMAKEQNISLNPMKISGCCGRLMCCLKYEQDAYESLRKELIPPGTPVQTPEGSGVVADGNQLTRMYHVKLTDRPDAAPSVFAHDQLERISPVSQTPTIQPAGGAGRPPREASPEDRRKRKQRRRGKRFFGGKEEKK